MATSRRQTIEEAGVLALRGLTWLATDPARLGGFMTATGISQDDLRANAATKPFQAAILGHFLQDETLLLVFATETGIAPGAVAPAHHLLVNAG